MKGVLISSRNIFAKPLLFGKAVAGSNVYLLLDKSKTPSLGKKAIGAKVFDTFLEHDYSERN